MLAAPLLLAAVALADSLVDEEGKAFTCNATVDCLQIKDADGEPDERIVCHRGSCKPYGIRIMQSCDDANDCDEKRCVCKSGQKIMSMAVLGGCDSEGAGLCASGEVFEVLEQRLICNERKKCQIPCLDPFCGGADINDKSHGHCNERGLCICTDFWEGNKCDRESVGEDGAKVVTIVEGGIPAAVWLGSMFAGAGIPIVAGLIFAASAGGGE
jgi:hypothetical protein